MKKLMTRKGHAMKNYQIIFVLIAMYFNTIHTLVVGPYEGKIGNATRYDAELAYENLGAPGVLLIPKFTSADFPGSDVKIVGISLAESPNIRHKVTITSLNRMYRKQMGLTGPSSDIMIMPFNYNLHQYAAEHFKQ